MRTFLVERYLPSATSAQVAAAVRRLADADATGVRHVLTMLILGEDTVLSCFEAVDQETIAAANEAAGFGCDRIIEVAMYVT